MKEYFLVLSKLGLRIRTNETYWRKIVTLKHPVMSGKKGLVVKTITNPDIVSRSERDSDVYLYYRKYKKYYICVVVRHENGGGFIISTYPVDKVKKGEIVYEKNKNIS